MVSCEIVALGTKNRQIQTAETCKEHLREMHREKGGLVEEFIAETEGTGKNYDPAKWGRFADAGWKNDEMLKRLDLEFDHWLNPWSDMKREPTQQEDQKITGAIFGGDRVEATNIYISITECGLTEAQTFIKTLTAELKESEPQKFVRRQHGRRYWWQPKSLMEWPADRGGKRWFRPQAGLAKLEHLPINLTRHFARPRCSHGSLTRAGVRSERQIKSNPP
jgi:hypothetical protein